MFLKSMVNQAQQTLDTVTIQTIKQIRKELEEFEFVHCGMAHEKIQRTSDGVRPLPDDAADHGLKRAIYCNSQIRNKRMACAHTPARIRLLEMLEKLDRSGLNSQKVQAWKQQVSDLDWAIIQVDQRKSDSELAHAQKSLELCENPAKRTELTEHLDQLDSEIKNQITEYDQYVSQLQLLRNDILQFLDLADQSSLS